MSTNSTQYKTTDKFGIVSTNNSFAFTEDVVGFTTISATAAVAKATSIPSGYTATFSVKVTAVQTGGAAGTAGDSAGWTTITGLIKNVAGTTSIVNSTGSPVAPTYNDAAAAAWRVVLAADNTADTLVVSVTGEASKTINWTVKIEVQILN